MQQPALLIGLLVLGWGRTGLSFQNPALPSSNLCGVTLRPRVAEFLHQVEVDFGRFVRCEISSDLYATQYQDDAASVLADGTPLIRLDSARGKSETGVTDALFRLKLVSQGFPESYQVTRNGPDAELLAREVSLLYSLILERLYYPQMRKLGLDPSASFRLDVLREMEQGSPQVWAKGDPDLRAIRYSVAAILEDASLTHKLESWFLRQGWREELSKGKLLADTIRKESPQTPDQARKAVFDCLGVLQTKNVHADLGTPLRLQPIQVTFLTGLYLTRPAPIPFRA